MWFIDRDRCYFSRVFLCGDVVMGFGLIETVYIYEGLSETAQMENARIKAKKHPHGLSNVCFHKHGESHNDRCYTLDINAKDDEDEIS